MSNYHRQIPRDLFNKSMLLKCLGQLSLLIHDNRIAGLNMFHSNPQQGFNITQDIYSGDISVDNIELTTSNDELVGFYCPLNSRNNYPLILSYRNEEYVPFDERGTYLLPADLFSLLK